MPVWGLNNFSWGERSWSLLKERGAIESISILVGLGLWTGWPVSLVPGLKRKPRGLLVPGLGLWCRRGDVAPLGGVLPLLLPLLGGIGGRPDKLPLPRLTGTPFYKKI